jgi:hypothetical protein
VFSTSSTGDTPKSRVNSRLNRDALSQPTARAAVPASYPSWAIEVEEPPDGAETPTGP